VLIVGLTGGIGAGKSTVAGLLARRGAVVIDVDQLGRQVVGPGGAVVDAVLDRFGADLRAGDGGIDRALLAERVFGDTEALAALTAISHPAINALLDETVAEIEAHTPDSIVVYDMAVLAESELGRGIVHGYELVVVVEAPADVRLERVVERGLARADARARMASQATDEERRALADFVIGNGGTVEALADSVAALWSRLQELHAQKLGG
jgi:dephospho-CoA kinase